MAGVVETSPLASVAATAPPVALKKLLRVRFTLAASFPLAGIAARACRRPFPNGAETMLKPRIPRGALFVMLAVVRRDLSKASTG